MKSRILGLLAVGLLSGPMAASAGVIFSDNFDSDSTASTLNFNSLINWTVSGGTIDYIRSGGYGINCVGGTGGCLDMDGSTGDAGRITSRATYNFLAGVTYTLQAQISGSQRSGTDSVIFGFSDDQFGDVATATFGGIAYDSAFQTYSLTVILGSAGSYRLFFEGLGGDNIGVILDSVVFSDDRVAAVPEPGTLALLGLGLAGLGLARRRRAN